MSSEEMKRKRLVLFDIDGTILKGGPLWKECFLGSLSHHFPGLSFPNIPFGGKTDVQIAREMIAELGLDDSEVDEAMRKVVELYVDNALEAARTRASEVQVLPGVREILERLKHHPDVVLGLLTGNVRKGALAKLSCVGLHEHFVIGVYGDDNGTATSSRSLLSSACTVSLACSSRENRSSSSATTGLWRP